MSVRPIEVQGSFPQSQKTGKIQEQMQQRGQQSQEALAQREQEANRLKQKQVKTSDETDETRFHEDGGDESTGDRREKNRKQKQKKETAKVKHPHKGKFIDFSG